MPVRWYFTDKPLLDKSTIYGSLNWTPEPDKRDYDDGSLGEVWGSARPWRDGSAPAGIDGVARGSDAAWLGREDPPAELFDPCGLWLADYNADYNDDYFGVIFAEE